MTPAYLSPSPSPLPLQELKEDDHDQVQFFTSTTTPYQASSSSSSSSIFLNIPLDQRGSHLRESQQYHQKVDKYILHGGSSDHQVVPSPNTLPHVVHDIDNNDNHKVPTYHKLEGEDGNQRENGCTKWMSSKMRLMKKMMNNGCEGTQCYNQRQNNIDNGDHSDPPNSHNNGTIRVCSDCNTTKTPLWRSGPQGPKSLCNACGIRQRKARRAASMAAAMAINGSEVLSSEASAPTKIPKVHIKDKKSRIGYVTQSKKSFKLPSPIPSEKKLSFEDFALSLSNNISDFQRVLPKDEEEAAILLMALSYGRIRS